ncbi:MAG: hypothetical protein PVH18_09740 [Chloroflexota bacterium]|jgi:hypothetical protein
MTGLDLPDQIQWRIHLISPPEKVFATLATERGRSTFWAAEAPEIEGAIHFKFVNGMAFESNVLQRQAPSLFAVEYFGGSRAEFRLIDDGAGGTDLTMTESQVPEENRLVHLSGWIPVLLALKAAVDFAIDLRNNDPKRAWADGYVDV